MSSLVATKNETIHRLNATHAQDQRTTSGDGKQYQPTPHGERYLKKTFSVTKGTGAPPTEES